ncbi:MAG: T9SS type A sorting domain-containing protein [Flavobacteriales bacterium]|nr:T9SS type A sorting domain-containing protein [Flavobacteriales bacterium]
MKTLYIAFSLCFVFCSNVIIGQSLYDSFDDVRTVNYGLNVPFPEQIGNGIDGTVWPGWHGVFLQYTLNPGANAINSSTMCASYSRNPAETYDVILIKPGQLADVSDYLSGAKQITMDIYSPLPGITVQFSLQNAALAAGPYPQGRHSEYQAVTTTGAQWETLTFTLTGEPWTDASNNGWWPDATTANNDLDEMVLLFNPGNNIQENYFFDNIYGPERVNEPCTEVNTSPFVLMDADCENDQWNVEYYDGRMSIFPNPDTEIGGNVIEYARNGGAPEDVIVGDFNGALTIDNTSMFKMDIYDPNAPSAVIFSIQDQFGLELALLEFTTTVSNQWETLSADLSSLAGLPNVTDFVLLLSPGEELAETYYIDNLIVENIISTDDLDSQTAFKAYPNPSQGDMTITSEQLITSVAVYDLSGKLVFEQGEINAFSTQLSGLAPGMYSVLVSHTASSLAQRKLVQFIGE